MNKKDINKLEEKLRREEEELQKKEEELKRKDAELREEEDEIELFFAKERDGKQRLDDLKVREGAVIADEKRLKRIEEDLVGRGADLKKKEGILSERENMIRGGEDVLTKKETEIKAKEENLLLMEKEIRDIETRDKELIGKENEIQGRLLEKEKAIKEKIDELSEREEDLTAREKNLNIGGNEVKLEDEKISKKEIGLKKTEEDFIKKEKDLSKKIKEMEDILKDSQIALRKKTEELEILSGIPPQSLDPRADGGGLIKPPEKPEEFSVPTREKHKFEDLVPMKKAEVGKEGLEGYEIPVETAKHVETGVTPKVSGVEELPKKAGPMTSDDLLKIVQRDKRIRLKNAAKELNISEGVINEWANELMKKGLVEIRPRFLGGVDMELTKDALKKIKDIEEERRVEKIREELRRIRDIEKGVSG